MSRRERRQKPCSNFGELKQEAGAKAQQSLGGLRVRRQHPRASGSRCGREGGRERLLRLVRSSRSWGCCCPRGPAGSGSRGQKGGSGLRRRDGACFDGERVRMSPPALPTRMQQGASSLHELSPYDAGAESQISLISFQPQKELAESAGSLYHP